MERKEGERGPPQKAGTGVGVGVVDFKRYRQQKESNTSWQQQHKAFVYLAGIFSSKPTQNDAAEYFQLLRECAMSKGLQKDHPQLIAFNSACICPVRNDLPLLCFPPLHHQQSTTKSAPALQRQEVMTTLAGRLFKGLSIISSIVQISWPTRPHLVSRPKGRPFSAPV